MPRLSAVGISGLKAGEDVNVDSASPATPPHAPALLPLVANVLTATLPGGRYLLPATLQPMLLAITHGEIRLAPADLLRPAEACPALPVLGLCGATRSVREAWATPGTQILAVTVRTGQLPRLFGVSAQDVMEEFVPLDTLAPPAWVASWAQRLRQAGTPAACRHALETGLCTQAARHMQRSPDLVLPQLCLDWPLARLAEHCQLGVRQFERQFLRAYGQSLRQFRQQWRCSQLLASQVFGMSFASKPRPWADIALDGAYFDQAHFSRDMRRFTGYSPAQLARQLAEQDPALWPYRFNSMDARRVLGME